MVQFMASAKAACGSVMPYGHTFDLLVVNNAGAWRARGHGSLAPRCGVFKPVESNNIWLLQSWFWLWQALQPS